MLGLALSAVLAATPVRVASYNILAGDRGLDGLIDTMKGMKADLIGLQEVDKGARRSGKVDQPVRLGKALNMRSAFAPHFDFQGGEYGVALLSRWPIVKSATVKVEGSRLSLLDAVVKAPFGEVRVVVVHFSSGYNAKTPEDLAEKAASRRREAEAAYALVKDEKRPSLVIGDMNSLPDSDIYALFASSMQDPCRGKDVATFPSDGPMRQIDFIFAADALKAKSCEAVQSTASDHVPLLVTLEPRK